MKQLMKSIKRVIVGEEMRGENIINRTPEFKTIMPVNGVTIKEWEEGMWIKIIEKIFRPR